MRPEKVKLKRRQEKIWKRDKKKRKKWFERNLHINSIIHVRISFLCNSLSPASLLYLIHTRTGALRSINRLMMWFYVFSFLSCSSSSSLLSFFSLSISLFSLFLKFNHWDANTLRRSQKNISRLFSRNCKWTGHKSRCNGPILTSCPFNTLLTSFW